MTDRTVTETVVKLVYVMPHPTDTDFYYEYEQRFPVETPHTITTQPDNVPGDVVLAVQQLDEDDYKIWLIGNSVDLEGNDPDEAIFEAFKVAFTISESQTTDDSTEAETETMVSTAYYDVRSTERRAMLPNGVNWHFLLKKQVGQDKYVLIYVDDPGPGQITAQQMCQQPNLTWAQKLKCALKRLF